MLTFLARLEGVSFALFLQSGFLCDVFNLLKTLTLDVIVCSHAPPASLYLSLFSLLAVDIRGKKPSKNFMTNFFKKRARVPLHCYGLLDKRARGFIFPRGEQRRIRSLCRLIWRLRLTLQSFVFLSLQHNRVCLAVSTLSK